MILSPLPSQKSRAQAILVPPTVHPRPASLHGAPWCPRPAPSTEQTSVGSEEWMGLEPQLEGRGAG